MSNVSSHPSSVDETDPRLESLPESESGSVFDQYSLLASPLGKPTGYQGHYAPELLFCVPRATKRTEIGVLTTAGTPLPFSGEDVWNAYELSWLSPRGKPIVALGEFRVPASSPCLIESKSMKLYLNSFNQTVVASAADLETMIRQDLSAATGAKVAVRITPLAERPERSVRRISWPKGELIDLLDIDFDQNICHPKPEWLTRLDGPIVEEMLYTHLLKSNCLVTGQPDWGTLTVRYRGQQIDRAGLLRYVVSFRQHHEFHEHCVERMFMDIARRCKPERLEVWARYTRRGGLDINPYRANAPMPMPENIADVRQ